jgi:hypothetical protein
MLAWDDSGAFSIRASSCLIAPHQTPSGFACAPSRVMTGPGFEAEPMCRWCVVMFILSVVGTVIIYWRI